MTDIELICHLNEETYSLYAKSLIGVAKTIDPDSDDNIRVERVLEKLKGFNADENAKFLLLKIDDKIRGMATILERENENRQRYVHVSQISVDDVSKYTETVIKVLQYVRRKYIYDKIPLYGIVKKSIWQAMRAYETVGAVEVSDASFPEWEQCKLNGRNRDFIVMNFRG